VRRPVGERRTLRHVIARWRRRTVTQRAHESDPPPPPPLPLLRCSSPRSSAIPSPPTSFHFFSSVPASDCRHSWLPSHRLSSCFPSLRLRFVPLPPRARERAPYHPPPRRSPPLRGPPAASTPRSPVGVPPFLSAAAFPARFVRGEPIVSRSSTVIACVSCHSPSHRIFVPLSLPLLLARSFSPLRCPAVNRPTTSSLRRAATLASVLSCLESAVSRGRGIQRSLPPLSRHRRRGGESGIDAHGYPSAFWDARA